MKFAAAVVRQMPAFRATRMDPVLAPLLHYRMAPESDVHKVVDKDSV